MKKTINICFFIVLFYGVLLNFSSPGGAITVDGYFSYEDSSFSTLVLEVHNTDDENGIYAVMFASNDDGGPWMTLFPPSHWATKTALIRYNAATAEIEAVIDGKAVLTQLPSDWLDYQYGYFFYTNSDITNGPDPIAETQSKSCNATGEGIQAMPIFVYTNFEMDLSPTTPYIPSGGGKTTMLLWVTESGSPAPTGTSISPYQLVEAAIAKAQISSAKTLRITAGKYYEAFVADKPCVLEAVDGTVTIGKRDYQSSTTLDFITLNTHLMGDILFAPTWEDNNRAIDIANLCANAQADVVCFQEIWDEDLFWGDNNQTGILPHSGYIDGFHGDENDCTGCWNSGLATMSLYPLTMKTQYFFSNCPGNPCCCAGEITSDCMAAKGWITTTLEKDGFTITVVNTHTQSGENGYEVVPRGDQIECLFGFVEEYRLNHPNTVIFVAGDFNVSGESSEYYNIIRTALSPAARDAARNVSQWLAQNGGYTYSPENELALCFDSDATDARFDYIYYFPSYDGQVVVVPRTTLVYPFRGIELTNLWPSPCGLLSSTEKSDHYGVRGTFDLYRK